MKMYDLGQERVNPDMGVKPQERGKTYPNLNLNDTNCPFLKDYTIGDTIKITVEGKITGIRESESWDDIKGANYFSLELRKLGHEKEE